jgi:predicted DNA-binding transcriptional regulator AlpA
MTSNNLTTQVPSALADVAYIDGPSIAAAAGMGRSTFLECVRNGDAPPPDIKGNRFTRWKVTTARAWLESLAKADATEPGKKAGV